MRLSLNYVRVWRRPGLFSYNLLRQTSHYSHYTNTCNYAVLPLPL